MAWQYFPLAGFSPDLPKTTPGALTYCQGVVPTDRGIGNPVEVSRASSSAMAGVSLGGCSVSKTDGTVRVFVGTAAKLYETTSALTTLTDRSDTSYSATTTNTWAFTQFGDVTLAVNKGNILRFIQNATAFAPVGTAPTPKASCMVTCGPTSAPFVMVADYDNGTNTPDGWFCSGLSDYTNWVTGVNQCANGRLIDDIPGPVVALASFRDDVVAWKSTGMYLGRYVGGTVVWEWRRVSADIGCLGKNSVCKANDIMYWADSAGVWQFDGSYPQLVRGNVHNFWAGCAALCASAANRNFARVMWDKPKHLLYVLAVTNNGIIRGLHWNAISGLWTASADGAEYGHRAVGDPNPTLVNEFITPGIAVLADKYLATMAWTAGTSGPLSFEFWGWVFDDKVNTVTLKGLRPQFVSDDKTSPGAASFVTLASQYDLDFANGGTPLASSTLTFRTPGKYDGQMSGNIITFQYEPTIRTAWEISGFWVNFEVHGKA